MAKQKQRSVRPRRQSSVKSGNARTSASTTPPPPSKLDRIVGALRKAKGATLSDLTTLTDWQAHSVRGALAGALKKRGLTITSTKTGAERVYRIEGGR
jgi:hypothetical protein